MIEQDPRITEGPTFFSSLYAWMKRVAANVNTNEKNIAANTARLLGFISGGTNAAWYIKFPTYLGSLIIQGGSISQSSNGSGVASLVFPIAFVGSPVGVMAQNGDQAAQFIIHPANGGFVTATGFSYVLRNPAAAWAAVASTAHQCNWIAGGF